jgi:uncharacterized protein YvpB
LLYGKLTEGSGATASKTIYSAANTTYGLTPHQTAFPSANPLANNRKASAMLKAPAISQYPELPSGCEITALTMLLQFYGIKKNKMELLPEMKYDTTPVKLDNNKKIVYWGNPNLGFVGDLKEYAKGFGIYHTALIELLKKYVPTALDLTGKPFEALEDKVAEGIPVEVWTTIKFQESVEWIEWDTSIGPIRTTFLEHAVLLVGYDKDNVYVNDPLTGSSQVKVNKALFIRTWELMEKQAISYSKGEITNGL